MKFSELVRYCEEVAAIDCDKCEHKTECNAFTRALEEISPVGVANIVKEDREF